MKKENKPYSVVSSKFLGESNGLYTYELTFNKSLEHTGKMSAMADGLNAYDKKEAREDFKEAGGNLWWAFVNWLKS